MNSKSENAKAVIGCDLAPDLQLNLNVRGIPPSATLAINERSDQLAGQGVKVYKMGLGQSPFPVPEIIVDELKRNAFQKDYLPVKGLLELRRAVAEHHRRTFGIECTEDDVLIGPGSKVLMFILQLVYYGDIVIPTPAWVSYAPQAQIIGRQIRLLHTRRKRLVFDPGAVGRTLPIRSIPPSNCCPELPFQSHRDDLRPGRITGHRRNCKPIQGYSAFRRNLRSTAS